MNVATGNFFYFFQKILMVVSYLHLFYDFRSSLQNNYAPCEVSVKKYYKIASSYDQSLTPTTHNIGKRS